ncbi:hypothetical protein ACLMAB_19685 [Brevibacillus laterosporus]
MIELLVNKNEIIKIARIFINENYNNGSDDEERRINKKLFISIFGKETEKEFSRILIESVNKRSNELTDEEFLV